MEIQMSRVMVISAIVPNDFEDYTVSYHGETPYSFDLRIESPSSSWAKIIPTIDVVSTKLGESLDWIRVYIWTDDPNKLLQNLERLSRRGHYMPIQVEGNKLVLQVHKEHMLDGWLVNLMEAACAVAEQQKEQKNGA